jgi:hypothetical protein
MENRSRILLARGGATAARVAPAEERRIELVRSGDESSQILPLRVTVLSSVETRGGESSLSTEPATLSLVVYAAAFDSIASLVTDAFAGEFLRARFASDVFPALAAVLAFRGPSPRPMQHLVISALRCIANLCARSITVALTRDSEDVTPTPLPYRSAEQGFGEGATSAESNDGSRVSLKPPVVSDLVFECACLCRAWEESAEPAVAQAAMRALASLTSVDAHQVWASSETC